MGIIDKILKEHSVILEQEETRREVYKINEDVEIGIYQTKDSIYMYAYSYSKDRNLSIKSNFKRLWDGFKKVAKDGYIAVDKGYTCTFKLRKEDSTKHMVLKEQGLYEKPNLNELEDIVHKLMVENEQLKSENALLKLELEKCSQIINEHKNVGRKKKFTDEQVNEIKRLNREENMSIRQLAKQFSCSVGLIHKVLKGVSI